jgi:hypothetical protein
VLSSLLINPVVGQQSICCSNVGSGVCNANPRLENKIWLTNTYRLKSARTTRAASLMSRLTLTSDC